MREPEIAWFATQAPDLYEWRSTILSFDRVSDVPSPSLFREVSFIKDNNQKFLYLDYKERSERIRELESLAKEPKRSKDLKLFVELAEIYTEHGDFRNALAAEKTKLSLISEQSGSEPLKKEFNLSKHGCAVNGIGRISPVYELLSEVHAKPERDHNDK